MSIVKTLGWIMDMIDNPNSCLFAVALIAFLVLILKQFKSLEHE